MSDLLFLLELEELLGRRLFFVPRWTLLTLAVLLLDVFSLSTLLLVYQVLPEATLLDRRCFLRFDALLPVPLDKER